MSTQEVLEQIALSLYGKRADDLTANECRQILDKLNTEVCDANG